MAAFPNLAYEWENLGPEVEPVVERTEMERGIAKQRRVRSDAQVEMPITVHFDTKAEADAFDDFFFNDIDAGQDFFDFADPVSGSTVQARIVGGKRGRRVPTERTLESSKQSFSIEFWRSTW